MTPKELFQKDKELEKQWSAVAHSDWFGRVMVYARSQLMEEKVTTEELDGARKFLAILLTLADSEPDLSHFPDSGIQHNLDVPKRTDTLKSKK